MDCSGATGLLGKVHRNRGMTVAALKRIVGFHSRPFVLGEFEPAIDELFSRCDRAKNLSPYLL